MKTDTYLKYNTISHFDLHSTGPNDGEPARLMIVKCADERFFLEEEYKGDWKGHKSISQPYVFPYVEPMFFDSVSDALKFAAKPICEQFGTDLQLWVQRIDECLESGIW